jgi:dienelactone hydrolase
MAEVLLFHHALGLTDGVVAFADRLRDGGHTVTVPDLYDGARFTDLDAGVAHAEEIGFERIVERGVAAAEALPAALVYAGFSLGVMAAQRLAQTRPGALGALLYHEGLPPETFGSDWPDDVALQVHVSEHDPWCDLDATRALVDGAADGTLHVYPGDAHLFTDAGTAQYDADATELVLERTLRLLRRWP